MSELSLQEIEADLAAAVRDISRLEAIVDNLNNFILDSAGEDRSGFKADLFKYEALMMQARNLRGRILSAQRKATNFQTPNHGAEY